MVPPDLSCLLLIRKRYEKIKHYTASRPLSVEHWCNLDQDNFLVYPKFRLTPSTNVELIGINHGFIFLLGKCSFRPTSYHAPSFLVRRWDWLNYKPIVGTAWTRGHIYYLATHKSQNLTVDTLNRGTTSKFQDFVKQIVAIGVIDHAESNLAYFFI